MGCAGSKLDDLEAVALCRDRSHYLADAIRLRYALADAHSSYLQALRAVGDSLHLFFDRRGTLPPPSPVLPLPTQRKGDPMPHLSPTPSPPPAAAAISSFPGHHHSRSNSGSHLQFHASDSEYSDEDDGPLHSDGSSPLHPHIDLPAVDYMAGGGGFTTYMNFAKKDPAVSAVSYEQRPMSPEVVHVGEPSYYGYYYGNPYAQPFAHGADGGMVGNFFGAYSPPPVTVPPPPSASPSSSRPPPPPPSPPKASTWDFLNPFESVESSYPRYTPSRSSKDMREAEGIPDLEEEEDEVVKEAYSDQKFVAAASSAVSAEMHSSKASTLPSADEDRRGSVGEQPHYQARSSSAGEGGSDPEFQVHLVDKNVVADEVEKREPEEVVKRKVVSESRGVSDVVQEIKVQFYRASDSCEEVSKMLEVGKHPYQRKKYEVVSSKMISTIVLPMSLTSSLSDEAMVSSENGAPPYFEFDEEKAMKSGNLSSTLQKLYIWEKKLYYEVKAEEKLRVLHDRKCKQLKHLDDRGVEAHKVDSIQALVKKLSTKIRIEIQVVDSISNKISKLRDEELWPQLNELIQGFVRMWRATVECHRSQCQAILESKNLDVIASDGKLSDTHMEATKHLELVLLRWIDTFCSWFNAQRNFVKCLNGWLRKCLHYEPEETPDGIAPFSPGRLCAPPMFVICNEWSQAMDNLSDGVHREVVAAMQAFAASVLQLWDQHKVAERQRMMANRDMDRRLRAQEREEQMINKAVDALNKKLVLVSDPNGISIYGLVRQNHSSEVNGLHEGLKQIFDAMESFAETSVKIYEDLFIRGEEQRMVRENARSS